MLHGITHSLIYQIQRPIRQHLHKICLFVSLFDLILYVSVNTLSATLGRVFLG